VYYGAGSGTLFELKFVVRWLEHVRASCPGIRMSNIRLSVALVLIGILSPCQRVRAISTAAHDLLQQIQQLIRQDNLTEARRQLTSALGKYPNEAGFYNLLGVVDAQQGQYQAAESDFKDAIGKDGRLSGAYLNLGHLYQENAVAHPRGRLKALEIYRQLLKFEPSNDEANYQSAVLLEQRGSYRESLEHLSRLASAEQERAQVLSLRCADQVGLGERSQADAEAAHLLANPGLTEADVISILPTLEAHQRDDLEVQFLGALVDRRLASFTTMHRLGLVYKRLGQLDRARAILEKEAEGQPNSVSPLIELARVADQQRDYRAALGYLAHARDLEPQNAGVHFFFGMVCVEMDLGREAYNSLKQAATLDPSNPYYNYALGAVSLELDLPEAVSRFREYCELRPQDFRGKFALGVAYFYNHKLEPARTELESVANHPETSAGSHYYLGRIADQQDNLPKAEIELKHALEANRNYADAYAELGHVRLKEKQYALAERNLKRALELDPENYTATLNLMILYERTNDVRAEAQTSRFEKLKDRRSVKVAEFFRIIEVRP